MGFRVKSVYIAIELILIDKKEIITYSDYICPFCYISKVIVERVSKEFNVSVLWKGLELHPEIPPEGRIVYASNPYISIARENATRLAQKLGLKLVFPNRISKSRFALEGAEFARDNNQFDKYHEAVFHAYFIEGKEIGDLDVLADLAETCELDKENFIEAMERRYYAQRVDALMEEARRLLICALPTFIIGKKRLIGVQPLETFSNVLKQIL